MLKDLEGVLKLILGLHSNYHKDPVNRKSAEYLEKRQELLQTYWFEFNKIAEQLPPEEIRPLRQ